jgi:hypothetical protein
VRLEVDGPFVAASLRFVAGSDSGSAAGGRVALDDVVSQFRVGAFDAEASSAVGLTPGPDGLRFTLEEARADAEGPIFALALTPPETHPRPDDQVETEMDVDEVEGVARSAGARRAGAGVGAVLAAAAAAALGAR